MRAHTPHGCAGVRHYGRVSDLEDLVPPHEPAEDAIAFAGRAALSLIPAVGPLASETLAYALEARQAQRQHEFNVQIARALTQTMQRIDSAATLEDVVGSDDFIAGVTRAQRAAAETASATKRQRLAAAVANGGGWAPFEPACWAPLRFEQAFANVENACSVVKG